MVVILKMKILRTIISTFFATLLALTTVGQTESLNVRPSHKNTIYFELFGNAIGYSFNYDRILISKQKLKTAGRIGISYIPPILPPEHFIIFPLEISELISLGKENHNIEIGLGVTFLFQLHEGNDSGWWTNSEIDRRIETIAAPRLGYRYQRKDGGIFWKAGYTPLFGISKTREDFIVPYMFGFSIGKTFN